MDRFIKILFIVLFALLFISFGFNVYYVAKDKYVEIKEKITTVTKIDTIRDTILIVKKEKAIKVIRDTLVNVEFIRDTVDTSRAVADIPIVQKEYSDDSTYTAWVSGYRPSLDSISIYRKNISTNKETVIKKKDIHRFGIGPVVYGGYNFGTKKLDYGIGIGLSYHILEW